MQEILIIIGVAAFVLTIWGMWRVFEKAGESGWKAVIPGYNLYKLSEISGNSGWWFLAFFLFLFPYVPYWIEPSEFIVGDVGRGNSVFNLRGDLFGDGLGNEIWLELSFAISAVLMVIFWAGVIKVTYDLADSFGKGLFFSLGLVFLPFIFFPILGLSEQGYQQQIFKARASESKEERGFDLSVFVKYSFLVILITWLSKAPAGLFGPDSLSYTQQVIIISSIAMLSALFVYLFRMRGLSKRSDQ